MTAKETTQDQVADFVLGFMDGITVGPALALGMYAGGADKHSIILTTVSDMIAGSIADMAATFYIQKAIVSPARLWLYQPGRCYVG